MRDRDRAVVTGILAVLVVAWLGFLVHRAPRFAGTRAGAAFGIGAALVMLVPLAYSVVKRNARLRALVTKRASLRTLLTWHVYAGIVGALLALIHTGHRFDSVLGIALTAMMMLLVVTGYVGTYLYSYVSRELHEKRSMLVGLRLALDRVRSEIEPGAVAHVSPLGLWAARAVRVDAPALRALRIAGAMADVERAIHGRERFESWFRRWLWIHVALSGAFYALLAWHVWAEIYYGLRWLR